MSNEIANLQRNRWRFAASVVLVMGAVVGVVAYTQARLKSEVLDNHVELARADARNLEDFLTQGLKSTDLLLQGLSESATLTPQQLPQRMVEALRSVPLLRSISFMDSQHRLQLSTNPANVGVALTPFDFMPHSDVPVELLRVGLPWSGRDFSDGRALDAATAVQDPGNALQDSGPAFIPLLREFQSDGKVQRLVAALNVGHLLNAYTARLGDDMQSIELLRYDGVLLLSTDPRRVPGVVLNSSEVMQRLQQREVGEFQESKDDGKPVLVAYRASSTHPLVTVVRYDRHKLLEPWSQGNQTLWAMVLSLLLVATVLATGYYVRLERAARARWAARGHMRLASSVFTHAQEAISITDLAGNIVSVNGAFTRITGYSADEVIGKNPRILSSGRQTPAFYADMWRSLKDRGHWEGEIWNRRKSGEVFAEMLNISVVPDEQGDPQNYVAIFSDISQQKDHQAQLERIAHFDALTNLPNRVLLADRLQQALAQAQRRDTMMAVVFLDLDGFKTVNDAHGHAVGDQLLVSVAQRLRTSLREGDTLARIGGDEFVAVLADISDISECEFVLERLLESAARPLQLDSHSLQVSASLGAALYPQDGTEPDTLLRHADQAMYQAKQAGKNRYQLFDVEQDISTRKRVEVRARVGQALMQREFVLHYQPKVDLRRGAVVGAEVLVRWQDPQRGLLAPGLFLPDIEGHALSAQLGDWVLGAALEQLSNWTAAGLGVPLSVNISAHHLQQPHFVGRLEELLREHPRVNPTDLELEVLETSALQDVTRVSRIMRACEGLGVSFALDDFGTGYSSLTYLKRLPASVLKIDQSFVRDMLDNTDDLAIVQGVIGLSKAFNRVVIAEGVETRAHGDLLVRLGCDLVQGYGIGRPMSAEAFPAWVQAWNAQPGWTKD